MQPMQSESDLQVHLMEVFARRTGVTTGGGSRRYLWTDAFALLNALDLYRITGEERWRDLSVALIDDVHAVLGRHRSDDPRSGWLSGLPEEEGARHPTCGGLRIGKPLPERGPSDPFDERLEWERDGQYWHYLTKWMDALSRAAAILRAPVYGSQAVELARATLPAFLHAGRNGLAWKMSVDLSRPLVPRASPHDALDGYVTLRWLTCTEDRETLAEETAVLLELARDRDWATGDPLGLGGLLLDACRLARLPDRTPQDDALAGAILTGVDVGLSHLLRQGTLDLPSETRLGFRELGLAIGLRALPRTLDFTRGTPDLARAVLPHLERLDQRRSVAARIIAFWSDPANRAVPTWTEHRDINEVMLATALLDAYTGTALS
ncbi:MAG: hypothetical protein R6V44_03325 [Paracoccaceae bacterium]